MATTTVEHFPNRFIVRACTKRGKVVGDVRFEDINKDGTYRVRMIYVQERYRRRGIGTLLMRAGMGQENVKRVTLSTPRDLVPFYTKLGFRIVKGNDSLIMHTDHHVYKGYDLLWDKTY